MKLMVSPRIQVIQSQKSNESADKFMGKSFLSARQKKVDSNSSDAVKSASFDKFEKMDFQVKFLQRFTVTFQKLTLPIFLSRIPTQTPFQGTLQSTR